MEILRNVEKKKGHAFQTNLSLREFQINETINPEAGEGVSPRGLFLADTMFWKHENISKIYPKPAQRGNSGATLLMLFKAPSVL